MAAVVEPVSNEAKAADVLRAVTLLEQEKELTIAQYDILRREGRLHLTDPETGEEYVLVPVAEYERLRGR